MRSDSLTCPVRLEFGEFLFMLQCNPWKALLPPELAAQIPQTLQPEQPPAQCQNLVIPLTRLYTPSAKALLPFPSRKSNICRMCGNYPNSYTQGPAVPNPDSDGKVCRGVKDDKGKLRFHDTNVIHRTEWTCTRCLFRWTTHNFPIADDGWPFEPLP